jgi:hypothetical protein
MDEISESGECQDMVWFVCWGLSKGLRFTETSPALSFANVTTMATLVFPAALQNSPEKFYTRPILDGDPLAPYLSCIRVPIVPTRTEHEDYIARLDFLHTAASRCLAAFAVIGQKWSYLVELINEADYDGRCSR